MKSAMKALSAMGIGVGIALGKCLGLALNADSGTTDPKPKASRGTKS